MRTIAIFVLAVLPACRKPAAVVDASDHLDVQAAREVSVPSVAADACGDEGVVETASPSEFCDASGADEVAGGAPVVGNCLPGCDVTTDEAIRETYRRISGKELEAYFGACLVRTEDLGGAIRIGWIAPDTGCMWEGVLHRCCLFPTDQAAARVLGALGWAAADAPAKGRLALLWLKWFGDETVGGSVLEVEPGEPSEFKAEGRTFAPPRTEGLPDGGVVLRLWVARRMPSGPLPVIPGEPQCDWQRYDLVDVTFGPNGSPGTTGVVRGFSHRRRCGPLVPRTERRTAPTRDEVRAKFESARNRVRSCTGAQAGMATVQATVDGGTGRVTMVTVGGDFTGRPATCIRNTIRELTFLPFDHPPVTVNYSYRF